MSDASKELASEAQATAAHLNKVGMPYSADVVLRLAQEIERVQSALCVAPVAKVIVREGSPAQVMLYAPGLPPGDHDVFPVPLHPDGQLRPFLEASSEPAAGRYTIEPHDYGHAMESPDVATALNR